MEEYKYIILLVDKKLQDLVNKEGHILVLLSGTKSERIVDSSLFEAAKIASQEKVIITVY